MTSLALETLRLVTGVFITESDFQVIELEYKDYIKENQYEDNEFVAEQFIEDWKEEQVALGTFTETSDGNIKYYSPGGELEFKTTMEFLDNMDMNSYYWENMCRRDWQVFRKILETGKMDKELLSNILEETITHEEIYELRKSIKELVDQLIEK